MKANFLVFVAVLTASVHAYSKTNATSAGESFNLSVQTEAGNFHCLIDEKPIDVTLSSDGEAVIVSGTGYVPVGELSRCKADVPVHVRRAAPQVGFLSDVNIKAGIYASMVPVGVSPLSFLAVVAKIGSDRNLVQKPGFYRTTVSESKLEEEAASDMNPVLSLDGKYISVDRHQCGSDPEVNVIEIKSGKTIKIDNKACGKLFNWVAK
ncbi:hypothetical protein [Paraburkholderia saeva]|uniref:Uncharacterized protein n=1 Tax=Paraburkholderia saeva TaxID=2777537 RepID=A0A9N8X4V1_9BURK|nr:hypothetical protein [Paraburkholderia saeva]CAG4928442.1 hypothetical protein LMG31841_05821 [Paraburkholderia saeva]CAG4928572.1 hypothetical protein R70241_05747 [Paraburkholderia saeva]CAG4928748.1 hypothetical protein R52603_05740 [Paraburkholderia saeva]